MPGSNVQVLGSTASPANATSVAVTLTATPTAGNMVKIHVRLGTTLTVSGVSDSKGNTWTVVTPVAGTLVGVAEAWCVPATALVSGDTVTVNVGATSGTPGLVAVLLEATGLLAQAPDAQGTHTGTSTAAAITTSTVPTHAGEMQYLTIGTRTATATATLTAGGWSPIATVNGATGTLIIASRIQPSQIIGAQASGAATLSNAGTANATLLTSYASTFPLVGIIAGTELTGNTGASAHIPVPAGVQAGSLILAGFAVNNNPTSETATGPTGSGTWVQKLVEHSAGQQALFWFYKYAGAADTGTYNFTLSGSDFTDGQAFRVTDGPTSGDPFTEFNSAATSSSSANVAATGFTPSRGNGLLINGASGGNGDWTAAAGFTALASYVSTFFAQAGPAGPGNVPVSVHATIGTANTTKAFSGTIYPPTITVTPSIRGHAAKTALSINHGPAFTSADYDVPPVAGDVLIAFAEALDTGSNNEAGTFITPTGWTALATHASTLNSNLTVFTRTATATSADNATFTTTGDGSDFEVNYTVHILAVENGVLHGTPVVNGTGTTPPTGSAGDLLIGSFGTPSGGATLLPNSMTAIASNESSAPTLLTGIEALGTPGPRTAVSFYSVAVAFTASAVPPVNVTFGAGATLSATGVPHPAQGAAFAAGIALTSTGHATGHASVAVAAGASLTTAGAPHPNDTAVLAAGTTLTATGSQSTSANIALTAGTTLTAAGAPATGSAVTLTAGSALTTAGRADSGSAAAFTASTVLTATGTTGGIHAAAFTAGTVLAASGAPQAASTVALTAGASLAAVGHPAETSTAALTAGTVLSATGSSSGTNPATFTAGTALTVTATAHASGSGALTAGALLSATGALHVSGVIAVAAGVMLTATGQTGGSHAAAFSAATSLTATGAPGRAASAAFTAGASLTVTGRPGPASGVTFTAGVELTGTAAPAISGSAQFHAGVMLTAAQLNPLRDITIAVTTGHQRWAVTTGIDTWAVTTGHNPWATTTGDDPWAVTTTQPRWATTTQETL